MRNKTRRHIISSILTIVLATANVMPSLAASMPVEAGDVVIESEEAVTSICEEVTESEEEMTSQEAVSEEAMTVEETESLLEDTEDEQLVTVLGDDVHQHSYCVSENSGSYEPVETGEVEWKAWTGNTSFPTIADMKNDRDEIVYTHFYLTEDINLPEAGIIDDAYVFDYASDGCEQPVFFCLNGYNVNLNYRTLKAEDNNQIIFCDCGDGEARGKISGYGNHIAINLTCVNIDLQIEAHGGWGTDSHATVSADERNVFVNCNIKNTVDYGYGITAGNLYGNTSIDARYIGVFCDNEGTDTPGITIRDNVSVSGTFRGIKGDNNTITGGSITGITEPDKKWSTSSVAIDGNNNNIANATLIGHIGAQGNNNIFTDSSITGTESFGIRGNGNTITNSAVDSLNSFNGIGLGGNENIINNGTTITTGTEIPEGKTYVDTVGVAGLDNVINGGTITGHKGIEAVDPEPTADGKVGNVIINGGSILADGKDSIAVKARVTNIKNNAVIKATGEESIGIVGDIPLDSDGEYSGSVTGRKHGIYIDNSGFDDVPSALTVVKGITVESTGTDSDNYPINSIRNKSTVVLLEGAVLKKNEACSADISINVADSGEEEGTSTYGIWAGILDEDAVKYGYDGGTVTVRCENEDDAYSSTRPVIRYVSKSDDGKTFKLSESSRIFVSSSEGTEDYINYIISDDNSEPQEPSTESWLDGSDFEAAQRAICKEEREISEESSCDWKVVFDSVNDDNRGFLSGKNWNENKAGVTNPAGIYVDFENTQIYVLCNEEATIYVTGDCKGMFGHYNGGLTYSKFTFNNIDTSNVTNMSEMFTGFEGKQLDLSKFNTSKVTDMGGMFDLCENLESVDTSSFDTSNVKYMNEMFRYCYKLKELDLKNFDTSNVKSFDQTFKDCNNLETLNVTSFDTRNVLTGASMFLNCWTLTTLDVSSFTWWSDSIPSDEMDYYHMQNRYPYYLIFAGCNGLRTIYASCDAPQMSWSSPFQSDRNLVGGAGTSYSMYGDNVENAYYQFYGRIDDPKNDKPGFFTYKKNPNGEIPVYKISYVLDGGSNYRGNPDSYIEGTAVTIKDPTKYNCTFMGWYLDEKFTKPFTSTKDLKRNITLYAKWKPYQEYKIKYDANAGSTTTGVATGTMYPTYAYIESTYVYINKNEYAIKGYKFVEWNTRPDGNGDSFDGRYSYNVGKTFVEKGYIQKAGDTVTLYAIWEEDPATLALLDKDGSPLLDDQGQEITTVSILYNQPLNVVIPVLDKSNKGYTLTGWRTEANGKGTLYKINGKPNPKSGTTLTLYAQWAEKEFKIKYNVAGGKHTALSKKNKKAYKVSTETFTLAAPVRTGYTFSGWYDAEENRVETIEKGSYGNLVLTARWTPITYEIILNGDEEKGVTVSGEYPKTVAYDEILDLYDITKTDCTVDEEGPGKYIAGWSLTRGGKVKYAISKKISKLKNQQDDVINLYPVVGVHSYKITYDLNDGGTGTAVNKGNPVTYAYNQRKVVAIKNPTRKGYLFTGWTLTAGTESNFDAIKKQITKGASGEITLQANWTPIGYIVKLNKNNGKAVLAEGAITKYGSTEAYISYNDTSAKFKTSDIVTNAYFTFVGWNTKKNGKGIYATMDEEGNVSLDGVCTKNKGTVVLYGIWKADKYDITYINVDPNQYSDIEGIEELRDVTNKSPLVYTTSAKVTLKNPSKYGFVFKGWYTDYNPETGEFANKVTAIAAYKTNYVSEDKDIKLYGKWVLK